MLFPESPAFTAKRVPHRTRRESRRNFVAGGNSCDRPPCQAMYRELHSRQSITIAVGVTDGSTRAGLHTLIGEMGPLLDSAQKGTYDLGLPLSASVRPVVWSVPDSTSFGSP